MDKTTQNTLTLANRLLGGLRDCLCELASIAELRDAIAVIGAAHDALVVLAPGEGLETDGSDLPNYITEAAQ